MAEKDYKEVIDEFDRHKEIELIAAEHRKKENFELMEELSKEQCREYSVFEMLRYEKLIFDYFSDKYRKITTTKKGVLANLSKAGNNLTDDKATAIFPSKLTTQRVGAYDAKPRKDKREEIEKFVADTDLSNLGIRVSLNDESSEIRFMDILILSLFYIYENGRVYKAHLKDGESYYKTQKVYTQKKDCYLLVLNKVLELFDKDFFERASSQDRLYASAQLYKIDDLFKFFKVCRMAKMREEIINSETHRNKAKFYYGLGCKEIEDIINSFDNMVFRDKEFIDFCLKSEYHDPFGYFKGTVNEAYLKVIYGEDDIFSLLETCKQVTKERIQEQLGLMSSGLEDVFESINAINDFVFEPKNKRAKHHKELVDNLIKKLHDIKYADINRLLNLRNSICVQTNEIILNMDFYEYFRNIMFVPDKTNFLNMLCNKTYDDNDAKSFMETHKEIKDYVEYAVKLDAKYHSFWEEYYLTNADILKSYVNSWTDSNEDYMKYLFEIVIRDLNKKCVLTGEK